MVLYFSIIHKGNDTDTMIYRVIVLVIYMGRKYQTHNNIKFGCL